MSNSEVMSLVISSSVSVIGIAVSLVIFCISNKDNQRKQKELIEYNKEIIDEIQKNSDEVNNLNIKVNFKNNLNMMVSEMKSFYMYFEKRNIERNVSKNFNMQMDDFNLKRSTWDKIQIFISEMDRSCKLLHSEGKKVDTTESAMFKLLSLLQESINTSLSLNVWPKANYELLNHHKIEQHDNYLFRHNNSWISMLNVIAKLYREDNVKELNNILEIISSKDKVVSYKDINIYKYENEIFFN